MCLPCLRQSVFVGLGGAMVSVLTEEETAVLSTLTDRIKEYQTEIALLRSLQTHM